MRFTYSRWDGTQLLDDLDADVLLSALADDLLEGGEVDAALARLTWQGVDEEDAALSGAKSLVDAFVRERERLRHEHRPGPLTRQTDAPRPDPDLWSAVDTPGRGNEVGGAGEEDSHLEPEDARFSPETEADVDRPSGEPREGGFGRVLDQTREASADSRRAGGAALAEPGSSTDIDVRADEYGAPDSGTAPRDSGDGLPQQRIEDIDAVEREFLEACRRGDLSPVDLGRLEDVLGRGARELLARLQAIPEALLRAGYLHLDAGQYHLTNRGLRRIGQKALDDIFLSLRGFGSGDHPIRRGGAHGSEVDGHKRYDADDHFLLDLNRTLLNAVARLGPVHPLALTLDDFEVVRTDRVTQASTVLMLDVSPSMPLRGCLGAGRKVALALNALIESKYPRDRFYLVAFSGHARQVGAAELHRLATSTREYGTNMQHALALARRLLAGHRGSRQVILITDGEPTAHLEGDRAHFSYPPTARTREHTLREVRRCTREDIVINTFMLDRSENLAGFVEDLTRINRGRAYFTTPERLGEYVVSDYVRSRQR